MTPSIDFDKMLHRIFQTRPQAPLHKSILRSLVAIIFLSLAGVERAEAQTAINLALEIPNLEWVYEKDDGGSDGQDKAWLGRLELVSTNAPLRITQQPTTQAVQVGQPASFSVSVEGSGTIAYQWYKGDEPIAFDEETGTESVTLTDLSEQRFFRLNKPQPTP